MVRLGQAPKSSEITLHFLVVECDSKYIITQNYVLSTFMRKNWRLKKCVPCHWSNRENNRHHNSRVNITQGMYHRIYSNLPCYKESIVRNIMLKSNSVDILSPWRFCCKKETKPTSSTQIRQNECLWPVQTTHITGFNGPTNASAAKFPHLWTLNVRVGRGSIPFVQFVALYVIL